MNTPGESAPMTDETFRERVLRARAERAGNEKLSLGGIELFEREVSEMRAQIEGQFPTWTAEEVDAEIHRRYARIREDEDRGFYVPLLPS